MFKNVKAGDRVLLRRVGSDDMMLLTARETAIHGSWLETSENLTIYEEVSYDGWYIAEIERKDDVP